MLTLMMCEEGEYDIVWKNDTIKSRGGNKMKKINFLVNPKWILLSFQYIRMVKKEFLIIGSILTLHI